MILSCRSFRNPIVTGWNFLLLKDWVNPMDSLAEPCFNTFDEVLFRLRADTQSTRPFMHISQSPHLSDLISASMAARKKLPPRYMASAEFFNVAYFHKTEPKLWIRVPSWMNLMIEDDSGELRKGEWSLDINNPQEWTQWNLKSSESMGHLHLGLFNKNLSSFVQSGDFPVAGRSLHFRMSELMERQKSQHLLPHLTLCLKNS